MTPREITQRQEQAFLSPFATLSENSRGRKVSEPVCDLRTDFCRDRDRIIHSKSFRRLKQKTQVFLSPEGDHFRTRLTHTLEVSQIARTIARALRLNEDLTEAIALGHDLGHTPFGHAGEHALNHLNPSGFRHYDQSVRVLEKLEKDRMGLNLTDETLEGIRCHTSGDWSSTPEGCAVRHADRVAFLNHDVEDAIAAGVLSETDLPRDVRAVLGGGKSARITTLITALVTGFDGQFHLAPDIDTAYQELYRFMFDTIYLNPGGAAKAEEHKVDGVITALYEFYNKNPEMMPEFYYAIAQEEGSDRAVTDYISGMTDNYALHCYELYFIPKAWGYRVE